MNTFCVQLNVDDFNQTSGENSKMIIKRINFTYFHWLFFHFQSRSFKCHSINALERNFALIDCFLFFAISKNVNINSHPSDVRGRYLWNQKTVPGFKFLPSNSFLSGDNRISRLCNRHLLHYFSCWAIKSKQTKNLRNKRSENINCEFVIKNVIRIWSPIKVQKVYMGPCYVPTH